MKTKSLKFFVSTVCLIAFLGLLFYSYQRRDEKAASKIISQIKTENYQEVYKNSSASVKRQYTEKEFEWEMKEILEVTGAIQSVEFDDAYAPIIPEPETDKALWLGAYKIYSNNGEFTTNMSFDNSDGTPKLSGLAVLSDSKWYGMDFR